MGIYNYLGLDEAGNLIKGSLDGSSIQHVQQQLMDMKMTVIELSPVTQGINPWRRWMAGKQQRVSTAQLSLFTFQFGTLLMAGIPIAPALKIIAGQTDHPYFKTVLLTVHTRVLEGHSIASGMRTFLDVFPDLYQGTVASGEKSGRLNDVMLKLAHHLDQQELIRQKIQQALIYPALLLSVSVIIIVFLLTYSIPTITKTFSENGQTLPVVTKILLEFCGGLKSYGMYCVMTLLALYLTLRHFLKHLAFRLHFQMMLLKIPFLKRAIAIVNSARFARTFGILFAAGIPVTEAMRTACNVIAFLPMKAAIQDAITEITKGVSIHQALSRTHWFTPISIQLIAAGEASGKLDIMLEKSADYLEQQVIRWISNSLALFEPLVILFMGIVVLFIVLAVLLPVFQMNDFLMT